MVAAELSRLQERQLFLERELETSQNNQSLDPARLDDEALTRLLGEETARVLNAARESANEIREKAEQSAARLLTEASDESSRLREEAEVEASRRRADAANDAEAELAMAKQQGREMVNEARAYRERVLSELARRRELAREQIEQLVHGRDRLMQSFERARVVAVDVMAEMEPLGEPDEYVNLTPSTGPVPVMVARADSDPVEPPVGPDSVGPDSVGPDSVDPDSADPGEPAADAELTDVEPAADAEVIELKSVEDETEAEAAAAETETETETGELAEVPTDEAETAETDEATDTAPADGVESPAGEPADTELDGPDHEPADNGLSDDDDAAADDVANLLGGGDAPVDAVSADTGTAALSLDDGSVDDVVVDLFARLRDEADDFEPDELDDDAGDEPEAAEAAETELAEIELADTAVEADDTAVEDAAPTDAVVAESTRFDQRSADLTPLIVTSARKLKRVLADEQNDVLDTLRQSDPVRSIDDLLPAESEHSGRYATAVGDDLLIAANAGASLVQSGRVAKLRKAAAADAVDHASEMIARWLIDPLRDRLEQCVSDGAGDNAAITKKVRAVYREFKTQHIDDQLDDVLLSAHGQGVLLGLEPDTAVSWEPHPDHQACADCDDNRLAGAVASGQEFPTGHVTTPGHPGCRCMLVPAGR